jgi:hypothetical protein
MLDKAEHRKTRILSHSFHLLGLDQTKNQVMRHGSSEFFSTHTSTSILEHQCKNISTVKIFVQYAHSKRCEPKKKTTRFSHYNRNDK